MILLNNYVKIARSSASTDAPKTGGILQIY
jgi:hypothetical protein